MKRPTKLSDHYERHLREESAGHDLSHAEIDDALQEPLAEEVQEDHRVRITVWAKDRFYRIVTSANTLYDRIVTSHRTKPPKKPKK